MTPSPLPLASRNAAILLHLQATVDHYKATGEVPAPVPRLTS